ncbi:DeoR/GlpR family DNA-binding transcription regulator [Exiguobacterium antarcticum]|uniref:DeoR/GlpR family DNA-binding transcription regulator n=1 Tax=Exiguobacterium antarcticum TaxID=132920 RepID=UPI000285EC2F|nr:DeoR/GlpR family DNA-binding transcription regulator [Exiguobacterium antarcticum]AFS71640.1 Transcriptional regulator, DeoR family protein [Exiguobacterium antarcticum B7]
MAQHERLQQMREWIKTTPEISLDQLMEEYRISRDTARRDLIQLEQEGKIIRVKNGLIRVGTNTTVQYDRRTEQPEKDRIAQRAITYITPHQKIILDAATTVARMTVHLPVQPVQVITNSLAVVEQLESRPEIELYVTGGKLDRHARSLVGIKTADDILNYQVDRVFLGACGLTEQGVFAENLEEAIVKKAMIRSSAEIIVLADHTKFEKRFLHKVCDLDQIDVLITDERPTGQWHGCKKPISCLK